MNDQQGKGKKQRDPAIDAVKGFAILFVVFGHALNNIIDSPRLSEVPASIIEVQKIVYSFHMPLFFFLSGIFAWQSVSKYDFFSSIKDKIRRLLVPYAFWSFMLAFVKVLFPAYQNHPETWDDFLYSWKNMHGIYWYLYILFLFFFIYIIIASLIKKEVYSGILFFCLATLLYMMYSTIASQTDNEIIFRVCMNAVYFSLGLFGRYVFQFCEKKGAISLIFILLFFACYYPFADRFPFLVSCLGILASIAFGVWLNKKNILACSLGAKSMDVYCMHQFVAGAIRIVLLHLIGIQFLWARVIFVTIVAVTGSYLIAISKISKMRAYRIAMGYR